MALVRGAASPKEIIGAVQEDRQLTNAVHAIKLAAHYRQERTWQTQCLVLYGPGRIGKSLLAKAIADKLGTRHEWGVYYKCLAKWWDGYAGQEIVIFDDFKPGVMALYEFKRVVDSGELQIEVKGTVTQFQGRLCIFTTNYHPKTWYPNLVSERFQPESGPVVRESADYDAFWRRLRTPIGAFKELLTRADIEALYQEYEVEVPEEPELALDIDTLV